MEWIVGKMVLSFISSVAGTIFHDPGQRQDVNVGVALVPRKSLVSARVGAGRVASREIFKASDTHRK